MRKGWGSNEEMDQNTLDMFKVVEVIDIMWMVALTWPR